MEPTTGMFLTRLGTYECFEYCHRRFPTGTDRHFIAVLEGFHDGRFTEHLLLLKFVPITAIFVNFSGNDFWTVPLDEIDITAKPLLSVLEIFTGLTTTAALGNFHSGFMVRWVLYRFLAIVSQENRHFLIVSVGHL
jgi:hypothetical protein